MFELADLKNLIFVGVYDVLSEMSEPDYDKIKAEADNTITRYTGYTNTEIADGDYSKIKSSIIGPYAHIVEHLALSQVNKLPDLQMKRISRMHTEATRQLSAMPRYSQTTGSASRVIKLDGVAEW